MINRMMKKNQLPPQIKYLTSLYAFPHFSVIPELVLLPKELDFPAHKDSFFEWQHFVDFSHQMQYQLASSPQTTQLLATIKNLQVSSSPTSRLIYCSFGTLYYFDLERVIKFINRLVAILAAQPHYYLVIVLDRMHHPAVTQANCQCYLMEAVDQIQILQSADLFITHGGLNSLKEAINAEVPVLCYPASLKWDQPGNADRVVYHGLGLAGSMDTDTDSEINEKVNQLLTLSVFKSKIRQLNQLRQKHYPSGLLGKVIGNLPDLP